jgi:hypothetical protein
MSEGSGGYLRIRNDSVKIQISIDKNKTPAQAELGRGTLEC